MQNTALQIKVTNHNDTPIEDRHDGILYRIPANGSVSFTLEAAKHIFGVDFSGIENAAPDGIRAQIFSHLQKRWGWNRAILDKDPNKTDPQEIFDNISFEPVLRTFEEVSVDVPVLAAPRKSGKNRFMKKEEAA